MNKSQDIIMISSSSNNGNSNNNNMSPESLRLAQEKRRTKMLLYLLAFCCAGLLGKQTTGLQGLTVQNGLATNRKSSRFLPESKQGKMNEDDEQPSIGLYVPSLDYRVKGVSQYVPDANFEAHVYCKEYAKDLKWEWWKADMKIKTQRGNKKRRLKGGTDKDQQVTSSKKKNLQKRLLIGVYAGYDGYAKLLEQAVWSARVYGKIWGDNVTVVTLQGESFSPNGCKAPEAHTTLNKIRLLFHAVDHRDEYDQVLLLDADAFVYNMDVDITSLLSDDRYLLGAQAIPGAHKKDVWNIHSGVTLWNLHHPKMASVAVDWFEAAKQAVVDETYNGDQEFLQNALRTHLQWQRRDEKQQPMVLNFQNQEFDYAQGTVVKQFIKDSAKAGTQLSDRLEQMKDAASSICATHARACSNVIPPQYETS